MKLLLAIGLLLSLAVPALAADAKPTATPDAAIMKTATAFFDAWNKNDVKTMTTFWTDDATLINPLGRKAHGPAEIEKLFTDEQTTVFKGSTAKILDLEVTRTLGSNMVLVDGEMTVDDAHGPDGAALPQMKFHLAAVMVKKGGHWMYAEARPYAFLPPAPEPAKTN